MRKILLLSLAFFMAVFAMAQDPATFEDVQLGSNGIWQPPYGSNEMPSGGWLFTNNTQNGYWGGFTASNRTDLNQSGLEAQYTAAAGCGYDGSTQYAVAYTMGVQTEVYAADGQSHTVTGCYVTNNLWTYQDILQGGYGETPYGGTTGNDPDWFKVTATGKNASGQTVGTLDFYLADYRFANNAEDYVLNTWEWFDLSPLGNVATISFSLSSSRGSGYNMITPAYFCMDNFNAGGVAPDLPPYIANPVQDVVFTQYPQTIQVNLNGVATDPDDPDENITYSIVSNSNPSALNATMNGKILVMTRQNANQATANLTMRATSDGQSVDFTVHVVINAIITPLSGVYTIDANAAQNPDFTSFDEAVSALSAGIAGEVIFEVAPGTYEEFVTLNAITGASFSDRVTFRGKGADNTQVVLTSNAGYSDNSTLTLNGTDYVSFENMTLTTTSDNKAVLVKLQGGNSDLRFEDVCFVGSVSTANLDNDKNLVYRVSGEWMDTDNAFVGCDFVNGYIALYYQGYNIYQYNDGLLVERCTFTNQSSKSVYVTFTDHVTVSGNTITNTYDIRSDYNAIDIFRCRYDCAFESNVINVTRNENYTTVFRLRPVMGTATEPVIIRNNIVNLQCDADYSYCFDFDNTDSEHIYFAHNTAKCTGAGICGNLFVEKSWENLWIYNNLFVNETNGYVFRFNAESEGRYCDYNRVSYTGNHVGIIAGTECASLDDWTSTSGFDAHSAICSPRFNSDDDLHLTSPEGLTVAHPLDYVPADFEGEMRSNTPCAGADEYNDIYTVGEWEAKGMLSLYPNPSHGMVTIAVDDASAFEYQVFDFTGKAVMKGQCLGREMTVDLSGVSKGVYFISVMTETQRLTQKVIVR